jgi:hypothetical protein
VILDQLRMSAMTKARWQRIALQQNLVSFRVDRFLRNPSRFLQRAGGPFYLVPDQAVVVRNRSGVESNTLRKPEILPPEEVRVAIAEVVEENYGAERDQLVQAVARLFGFGSTSAPATGSRRDGSHRSAGCRTPSFGGSPRHPSAAGSHVGLNPSIEAIDDHRPVSGP